jgi:hypothetical protein
MKLLVIMNVDFNVRDQLPIKHSAFITYWRKNGSTMGQYISYLEILRRHVTQTGGVL